MRHGGLEKWAIVAYCSLVELVELMEGFTHYESVVRKVGHDKNNLVSVSHTRVDGDDTVMTTAEKQKENNWYNCHLSLNVPLTIDQGDRDGYLRTYPIIWRQRSSFSMRLEDEVGTRCLRANLS